MEAYGDISVSCIVNIASLAIGVVAHIVVWKTGFFDKIKEEEKNKVSEEPKEKLGKKQPSMYDQYDNDDLYEQDKPEKKIDTQKKSDTYYEEDYTQENYAKVYDP